MSYTAPVRDIAHALATAGGLPDLTERGLIDGFDADTVAAILEEAGKFAGERLAPLDATGDAEGVRLENGVVRVAAGWTETYRDWCAAGWGGLPAPAEFGGQELPHIIAMAVSEMWNSANLSFGLGPLLTHGAIDALMANASPELKARYVPNMVTGRWMGTMNLTEPQAGTDLGHLRAKAEPADDGSYRISGTKIFITYGDHEMVENIVHLVLARIVGAPAGTKGISLFVVPKFVPNPDGSLGARNDVRCAGLEKKLGIHAAPTCVMSFGENGGATGWLVGEAGKGLAGMFVMMNRARLGVGVQGVAIAERATQRAIAYAHNRKQGRAAGTPAGEMAPIVQHPDVRRMLTAMRARTVAARALCAATARALDTSTHGRTDQERQAAADRLALLTPLAKAWSTDTAVTVASLGVQVHGGTGFIEATGAAQCYRDARILPIYEGTNGVQALDLVTRKLTLGGGAVAMSVLADVAAAAGRVASSGHGGAGETGARIRAAGSAIERTAAWLVRTLEASPERALAVATPFQELFAETVATALVADGAVAAGADPAAAAAHWPLAQFLADTVLATVPARAEALMAERDLPTAEMLS